MVACAASSPVSLSKSSTFPVGRTDEEAVLLRGMFLHVLRRFASAGAYPCVPRLGLAEPTFGRLLAACEVEGISEPSGGIVPEDFWDLASLLTASGDGSEETRWVAHAIAAGCLADDHLWRDLGLPDRRALTRLLERYFRPLRERNVGEMRWKKFFYKELCEQAGFRACKAPSCGECSDYAMCFGKE